MLNKLKGGILGDVGGQVGGLGKQIGIGMVKAGTNTVKTVPKQVVGKPEVAELEKRNEKGTGISPDITTIQRKDENTKDIVNVLYAKSEDKKADNNPMQQISSKIAEEQPQKSPEENQKMAALRLQLHNETYADKIINPERRQQEEQIEEQKEEQEEEAKKRWELQEKKKEDEEKKAALQKQQKSPEKRPGAG